MFGTLVIICVALTLPTDVVQAKPRPRAVGVTLHKMSMSWEDADRVCEQEGGILASPTSDDMLQTMKSLKGVKNTTYFLGMKSAYYTAPFVSVEGVLLDDMSAAVMDMIDAIDQLDGDCLAMNDGSIRAVPCWSRLPFMCDHTHNRTYAVYKTPSPVSRCGPHVNGFKYHESQHSCYKAHLESTDQVSWWVAEQTCIAEGAHLVVIDDENEARAVRELFQSVCFFIWNGIRDMTGYGKWESIYGQRVEEIFNVWYSNSAPKEHNQCGGLRKDLVYGWSSCDHKGYNFICEKLPLY